VTPICNVANVLLTRAVEFSEAFLVAAVFKCGWISRAQRNRRAVEMNDLEKMMMKEQRYKYDEYSKLR
jgi:hypothetical protein